MGLSICTMAKEINFDQTFESLNYNSESDPDFDPCEFYTRNNNKQGKNKKLSRRSSSPIAGSSENALSDCFEESVQNQEVKNVVLVDSAVQVNARNFPRKKYTMSATTRVTRSKKKSNEISVLLETLPENEEVSSQSLQVDETMNEPLPENLENFETSETSETSVEPQRGPENNLYMQNTVEGLTSSIFSLEAPSLSELNSSNNENHAENPSGNQEIKKTLILNINLLNAGNNMNQPYSFTIPMDDKIETLNIALNPENIEMAKPINEIPSTSEKKKVKITFDSDPDEKKSHKKKSKGKKKYSKKRSTYYSSDSECSCSDCLGSSSYYTSSSEDECCRKHCSCSKKDVKEKSSKKYK